MSHPIRKFILLLVAIILLVLNVRLYKDVDVPAFADELHSETIQQLNFLGDALRNGAADDMQALFPEGFVFTNALYGLSWTQVARYPQMDAALQQRATAEAFWALEQIDTPKARAIFPNFHDLPGGIFYLGWTNWLRGSLLASQAPAERDSLVIKRFRQDCRIMAEAYRKANNLWLPSYQGWSWPADNAVGMAAVRLNEMLFDAGNDTLIANWIEFVRTNLDTSTDLVPHSTQPAWEGARGSSTVLICRIMADIDPQFSKELYVRFRKQFVTHFFGLPAIREYPHGLTGSGDVDSGPVFFGVGASATVVALAAARANNDIDLWRPLSQMTEMLGMPLSWNEQKYYSLGQLPIGDAFLVWGKTARPFLDPVADFYHEKPYGWWWRWPFHLLSGLLILGMWRVIPGRRKNR